MKLVVPTFFDKASISFFEEANASNMLKIAHTYGSMNGILSSRESHRIQQINGETLKTHVEELSQHNIEFFYALNAACIYGKGNFFKKFVDTLYSNFEIKNFIIANPELLFYIRDHFRKNVKIKLSVIADVRTAQQFNFYDRYCDFITLSTAVNRDFKFLKSILNKKDKIELLANEACLFNCPMRNFHYMREGHDLVEEDEYVKHCYNEMTNEQLLMSRWIMPEDLYLYEDYTNLIKISGRSLPFEFTQKCIKSYGNGKTKNDNLLEIMPVVTGSILNEQNKIYERRILRPSKLKSFVKNMPSNCNFACPCGYCKSYVDAFEE